MDFKTKLVILSLIVIGGCLLQIVLHKKTYEGFSSVTYSESSLSFSQLDRKYDNSKDCKLKDFEVGQYVEINQKNVQEHPTSEYIDNLTDLKSGYYIRWININDKTLKKGGFFFAVRIFE